MSFKLRIPIKQIFAGENLEQTNYRRQASVILWSSFLGYFIFEKLYQYKASWDKKKDKKRRDDNVFKEQQRFLQINQLLNANKQLLTEEDECDEEDFIREGEGLRLPANDKKLKIKLAVYTNIDLLKNETFLTSLNNFDKNRDQFFKDDELIKTQASKKQIFDITVGLRFLGDDNELNLKSGWKYNYPGFPREDLLAEIPKMNRIILIK